MHWIIFGMIFILTQSPTRHKFNNNITHRHQQNQHYGGALATPLPQGKLINISIYFHIHFESRCAQQNVNLTELITVKKITIIE